MSFTAPKVQTSTRDSELLLCFAAVLAPRVGRPLDALLADGLGAGDFPYAGVQLTFDDHSTATFRYALAVVHDGLVGVFTEHCGYHCFVATGVVVETVTSH